MINDLKKLEKYEPNFNSAINANFSRALWKDDFDVLISVYNKWTNTNTTVNGHCSKCKLEFIKKVGKLYYKNKEEYDNKTREKKKKNIEETSNLGRGSNVRHKSEQGCKNVGKRVESKRD